jgi:transcription initiation factor TFIIIB Brf1 subunit/transcription initiation factor TFIIB
MIAIDGSVLDRNVFKSNFAGVADVANVADDWDIFGDSLFVDFEEQKHSDFEDDIADLHEEINSADATFETQTRDQKNKNLNETIREKTNKTMSEKTKKETKKTMKTMKKETIKNMSLEELEKLEETFSLERKIELTDTNVNYKKCPECGLMCKINETTVICEKCGLEREYDAHNTGAYSSSIDQGYNTSNNSFMSFKVIGKNYYNYSKNLYKTCANYPSYRNNSNRKEIINKIYRYEGGRIPLNVCNMTADLFDQIKQRGYVFRGNGKWGVIGACLFYSCIICGLSRTPREIANIIDIEDKFLSQGDRILQGLNELKIISIPVENNPISDYLNQYLPALGIPIKYKQFIIDLISRADVKRIYIGKGNQSRITTKCVGAIYLLCMRMPNLNHIKKDDISRECVKISKSTFIRQYNLLMEHGAELKKVFRKHKIPMPVEWRDL